MGMRYYVSAGRGSGGRLKATPTEFRVTERPGIEPEALDADDGDYPYLVVEAIATGRDTNGVIEAIASALSIHPGRVSAAGSKDANAVTTQWLSIRGIDAGDLPAIEDVELTPIGRFGRQLEFGDHAGNAFEIGVSDMTDPAQLAAIHDELREGAVVSVPNYFGHQRFGTRRAITHDVGRQLLRDEYRAAVETYLTASSPQEPPRTRQARRDIADALVDADVEGALAATPGYLDYERRLLEVLHEGGADPYRRAIEALPWSLTRLFVHAVQSHIFNELVSERLRRGLSVTEPVVGDVICFVDAAGVPDPDRAQPVTESRLSAARRHCARDRAAIVGPLVGPETPTFSGQIGHLTEAVLAGVGLCRESFADIEVATAGGTWRPLALSTAVDLDVETASFAFELPPGAYATVLLREYCKVAPDQLA